MGKFISIQPSVICENCIICGSRPVIEQNKGKFTVRCPKDNTHYQTPPGLIDINGWNTNNKTQDSGGELKLGVN
ncbi:hypothetical protein SAMN05428947_116102 [Mucilaginibacter sp. OK283]|jgi:hypothetical protein|nr:hypothetical protein SAMN05428947_116102 [Mucilaginibacter sp. OK283]